MYIIRIFSLQHPGGGNVIVKSAGECKSHVYSKCNVSMLLGKDATEGYERAFHSPKARGMLKDYLIGKLPPKNRTGLTVMQGLGQGSRRTGYPSLQ